MRKFLVLALAALLLAGCGNDQHSDLRQELKALTKGLRGHVKPLPQVKPYQPVSYDDQDLVDPFRPDRIVIVKPTGDHTGGNGIPGPDLKRPKEPLEAFPLESIKMVGTITEAKQTYGLVKAGANLYRVKKGNYMGQNYGVVVGINDTAVELKEMVQDAAGDWIESKATVALQE